jgi:hypothetical protein
LITCAPPKAPAAAPSPRIIAAIASAVARERSRASGTSSHSIETFCGFAGSTVTGSTIPGCGQRLAVHETLELHCRGRDALRLDDQLHAAHGVDGPALVLRARCHLSGSANAAAPTLESAEEAHGGEPHRLAAVCGES